VSNAVARDSQISSERAERQYSSTSALLSESMFLQMLCIERKRAERSRRRFALMLLDCGMRCAGPDGSVVLDRVLGSLLRSTRESDLKGWYDDGSTVGVIFTEIGVAEGKTIEKALLTKVSDALSSSLSLEEMHQIRLSFYVFPEQFENGKEVRPPKPELHPDMLGNEKSRRGPHTVKRAIDIAFSAAAVALLAPFLILIAIAIKTTSKGPVLFRQRRVGYCGKSFNFLKFRSMYANNDPSIHREYVSRMILGELHGVQDERKTTVYKIVNDPRVTPVGRFLRRTSLDELPQFLNVLSGDMSLVGPRPPLPYEIECYDIWHRRRLIDARPGITGLWQVAGRSRTTFDEMVRLDLRYARSWSLWLDFKILFQTPRAVLSGSGAY
jgi:exopolysaccharide biosynthesis polyprenyl glycosylphosphotransferase